MAHALFHASDPSDAADLFEPDGCTLNHGGRAYRRRLIASLVTQARQPLVEANRVIFELTGVMPRDLRCTGQSGQDAYEYPADDEDEPIEFLTHFAR